LKRVAKEEKRDSHRPNLWGGKKDKIRISRKTFFQEGGESRPAPFSSNSCGGEEGKKRQGSKSRKGFGGREKKRIVFERHSLSFSTLSAEKEGSVAVVQRSIEGEKGGKNTQNRDKLYYQFPLC